MISATEERIKTNKLLMDICNFNKDLFDTSTLSSDEIRYYNKITDGFNKQIQFFIDWLDSDEAKRIFQDYTRYNEQAFNNIDEYTQEIIENTKLTSDEIIDKLYDTGLTNGYKEIRRTKHYNDATKYGLKFLQDYNFSLITNVNEDLKKHIKTQIFNGIVAGETMPEVAQKILHAHETSLTGKTLSARQRAMMIARTETARAMTQGRLQSYANYGVQEVKILTAGDNSVCAICREAADKIFPISEAGNLVPFHPLCRCSVMAYIRHGILPGNPNDNEYPIILIPDTHDYLKGLFNSTMFDENSELSNKILPLFNERIFKEKIKGFVDKKDIDLLTNLLKSFRDQLPNVYCEFGAANLLGNISIGFGDWKGKVKIPKVVQEFGYKYSIPILIHNHPYSTSPFPSYEDFESFAAYGVKYGVVTNDLGTFIVKNNNVERNRDNVEDIGSKILDIKKDMIKDFNIEYSHKYDNNIPSHVELISQMVNEYSDKYLNQYQEVLLDYGMEVMFINNKI